MNNETIVFKDYTCIPGYGIKIHHHLKGSIITNNTTYNLDNGIGYIEKDWGKSMPSDWIWMQTNHFNAKNTSFMLSVATIPWIGNSFTGFLGFFLHNNKVHRFGTYTHAKLHVEASSAGAVKITITDKTFTYHIETSHTQSGELKAPVKGSMDRRISESIDAALSLKVIDKQGNVVFDDKTSIAGLETVGTIKL